MLRDRVAIDLPLYDGLLAGHYLRGPGYSRKRPGGTDDWLLVMTLSGQGVFRTAQGEILVNEPDIVLVSPGSHQDYGISKEATTWAIYWVHFKPKASWLDLLKWPSVEDGHHVLSPKSKEIREAFKIVIQAANLPSINRIRLGMNALERLLLLCAEELPQEFVSIDERIHLVVQHIHTHIANPLSNPELATVAGISESRMSHLFRQEIGVSPRQYVHSKRMEKSKTLLERTNLSVYEIAAEVGMDPFYFSLRFKAETGSSPTDFRRNQSNR